MDDQARKRIIEMANPARWPLPWPLIFRWSLERRTVDVACHGFFGVITQAALLVPEAGEILMDAIERLGHVVCGAAQGAAARRLREEITGVP